MLIISGTNNSFAKDLANKFIKADVRRYEDGELKVIVPHELYKQDVVIIQSTSNPANDNLMELLLLIDAAKMAEAKSITAVIPYFCYARQDKLLLNGPFSANLVVKLLEASGVNKVITLDLHSENVKKLFSVEIINLSAVNLFRKLFIKHKKYKVVSPDFGGALRAKEFSEALGCDYVVISKSRKENSECVMEEIIGDVEGYHCIIIDDIVDTANTLCKAAELLNAKGAALIEACVTHPVFSSNAVKKIEKSKVENLYITDSIVHTSLPKKIKVISAEELFLYKWC